ncbi:MAG: SMC-Scp complex subunit ScpB [Clostridiales bacterium]|jgi:segregation and condensation protein B|nr:SMC-Scp complex subunit ScpB [Clostridiales bacterium]
MTDGLERESKLTVQELPSALEAILFAHGDPISLSRLAEITDMPKEVLVETLDRMMKEYETNPWGGLLIRKADEDYVMCTKPAMKPVLEKMFAPKNRPPMSQATYETLAVIAYNQPVTRAQIEAVRGVSSDSIVSRLIERGFVEECGTLEAPGRPALFRTTQQFLLEFGISSVSEMPAMELMMYKTIRDLEDSLDEAAGNHDDRQISIESWMDGQKGDDEDES